MVEDAKAAERRRLAEALRANLKRRKAASQVIEASGSVRRGEGDGSELPTPGKSRG